MDGGSNWSDPTVISWYCHLTVNLHIWHYSGPCSDVCHLGHSNNLWTALNWTELIWYLEPAKFPLSGQIHLQPDCMFYTGSYFYNLPMQPVDCLTDVEPTVCALLEPADQWPIQSLFTQHTQSCSRSTSMQLKRSNFTDFVVHFICL